MRRDHCAAHTREPRADLRLSCLLVSYRRGWRFAFWRYLLPRPKAAVFLYIERVSTRVTTRPLRRRPIARAQLFLAFRTLDLALVFAPRARLRGQRSRLFAQCCCSSTISHCARSAQSLRHSVRNINSFSPPGNLPHRPRRRAFSSSIAAAHVGAWYTGGGYASSAVDVYVSGGSTEMFGSRAAAAIARRHRPSRRRAPTETRRASGCRPGTRTASTAPLPDGGCVERVEPRRAACDAADGCTHDGSSCRVADTCASGVKVEGTDMHVSQVFAEFPDNFFMGLHPHGLRFERRAGLRVDGIVARVAALLRNVQSSATTMARGSCT